MPLFSLVLAAALSVALPMPGSATATSPATQRHRVALKPGPKTTVFTGPLRKDGTVDYIAAWNQKYSKGVTPKNNGVVDIVNTMKPEGWKSSKIRKKFYNRLGVVPPGKNAPTYFINLFDFAKQQRWNKHKTDKAVDNILLSSKPWPAAVYPMAAAWVRANQSAIDAMKRAVAKPCWYAPMLLKGSDGTLKLAISWVGQESLLAHLICAQAMLRLHKRDVAGAWRNAMLLEHFSRISSTTPVLMNRLISISLDTFARGNIVMPIAKRGSLNPKQAKAMITDLRHLPPLQDTSEVVDQTSRIIALRFAQMLWAGRYPDQKDRHALRAEKQMHEPGFNINVLLRQINQACDHEIQILRLRPYPAMVKARKKFMKQLLDKLKKEHKPVPLKELMTDFFIARTMPSLLAAETAYRKSIMWHGLTLVTVALAGYHAEHGKYPLKLPVLAPEFLPKVPRDLFIDKPLHYKNTAGGGVLLYSVGENMHDDGGHMQTMFSSSGSGPLIIPENAPDDLAVRLGK